jgi:cyclopropane-fatty-acyl-phospholipid synthase
MRLVTGAFTERRVAELSPFIDDLVAQLVEGMAAKTAPADVVDSLAVPLPLRVLCSVLGISWQDHDQFGSSISVLFEMQGDVDENKARALRLARYMTTLVTQKRRAGGDDLICALLRGTGDEDRLSNRELVTLALSLLMAGYETTVDQLSLAILSVLASAELRAMLRADFSLIPAAVEEIMRISPAASVSFPRLASERMNIAGQTVERGQPVVVSVIGANHSMRTGAVSLFSRWPTTPPRSSGKADPRRGAYTNCVLPGNRTGPKTNMATTSIADVESHYDIGNEFYALWLDETLTYSAALWKGISPEEPGDVALKRAQQGWGGLMSFAVGTGRITDATGLTLSHAQLDYVTAPNQPGTHCYSLLRPGASMSLQTIAYDGVAGKIGPVGAFITGDVFPGSTLPRLAEIAQACDPYFAVRTLSSGADDYVRTLAAWSARLHQAREEAKALVGQDVVRRYQLYLRVCETIFRRGGATLYRIGLERRAKPLVLTV